MSSTVGHSVLCPPAEFSPHLLIWISELETRGAKECLESAILAGRAGYLALGPADLQLSPGLRPFLVIERQSGRHVYLQQKRSPGRPERGHLWYQPIG